MERVPPLIDPERSPLRRELPPTGRGPEPERRRGILGALGVVGLLLAKFGSKLAFLAPLLKWVPAVLKTGGTMILSIAVYALQWGWRYAVGFVVLILIHEFGHLVAARYFGLKVGAPVFIPFMGAFIALKEAPRNAWIEAVIGIGGPVFGTLGALVCLMVAIVTGQPLFAALAFTGFFLNLFNLAPVGFLDGGRIVTALSPWLWVVGYGVMGALMFYQFNPILLLVLLLGLPRLFSLFRARTSEEQRFFEVSPGRRIVIGLAYFGLIGFLVLGMMVAGPLSRGGS